MSQCISVLYREDSAMTPASRVHEQASNARKRRQTLGCDVADDVDGALLAFSSAWRRRISLVEDETRPNAD